MQKRTFKRLFDKPHATQGVVKTWFSSDYKRLHVAEVSLQLILEKQAFPTLEATSSAQNTEEAS